MKSKKKSKKLVFEGHVTAGDMLMFQNHDGPLIIRRLNDWHEFQVVYECRVIVGRRV